MCLTVEALAQIQKRMAARERFLVVMLGCMVKRHGGSVLILAGEVDSYNKSGKGLKIGRNENGIVLELDGEARSIQLAATMPAAGVARAAR